MPPEVTPQKTAELAISKAEQRFREVFERSPAGVARVGMDGTWLEVNDKFCEMLGYSREELFDIRPWDLIYPEDRKEHLEERDKLISGEAQQVSTEKRYLCKDGRVIWLAHTGSLVRDASGTPQYFVAVAQDVTDRKQAEKKLRQATQLSSAAMAASRIAIFRWDLHTGEWEWDRTGPVIGQLSAEVLRNIEGWLTLVVPEDREDLFERLNRSAKVGVDFEHEFRVTLPPGNAITWLYARGKIYRGHGGEPDYMTGAVVDMTEYRQLRRELADNQQMLLLAKSAAGVHAWAVDVSRTRRIWWTPLSYRLYGRSEELGPPTREEFLNLVYPQDRNKVLQVFELLQKSGNDDTFSLEFRTAPTSGRVRWIFCKGGIQRDAGGWPLRLVGVDIDITERREAEQALRRVEKLAALDRLATSIAHQINNPLMAASNLLYLGGQIGGKRRLKTMTREQRRNWIARYTLTLTACHAQ